MQLINNDTWVNAPIDVVFAAFKDHHQFTRLFGKQCEVVALDETGGFGLHSVRRMKELGGSFDETIRRCEPNAHLEYEITRYGPLPIKNHYGTLIFTPHNGGTQVHYSIRFEGRFPLTGWLIKTIVAASWNKHAPAVLAQLK